VAMLERREEKPKERNMSCCFEEYVAPVL